MKKSSFNKSGTTLAAVLLSPGNGQQHIESIYATSDLATSVLKVYPGAVCYKCSAASPSGAKNLFIGKTAVNGYTPQAGDTILAILAAGGYVVGAVASVTENTKIVTSANLSDSVAVGDYVYVVKQGDVWSLLVGAATKAIPTEFYVGKDKMPVYVTIDGTSACSVFGVANNN